MSTSGRASSRRTAALWLCALTLGGGQAVGCGSTTVAPPASPPAPELGETARGIAFAEKQRADQAFVEGPLPVASRRGSNEPGALRRRGAARARPDAVPIALDQLPVARVPAMLHSGDAPSSIGSADAELEIRPSSWPAGRLAYGFGEPGRRNMIARARTLPLAELRVGKWVGWTGGVFEARGGTPVACGPRPDASLASSPAMQPARWEGVRRAGDGRGAGLEYEITDGWFDQKTCRATVVRRTRTPLAEIVPGVLYGFRDRCDCGVEEVLTLVMPSARNMVSTQAARAELRGTFTRVRLPIGDAAESMMAHLGADDVVAWSRALLPVPHRPAAAPSPPSSRPAQLTATPGFGVFIAVEVSGSGADPSAAHAVAFVQRGRQDGDVPDLRPRDSVAALDRAYRAGQRGRRSCECEATDPLCGCL